MTMPLIRELAEQAKASVPAGLLVDEWIAKYNQIFAELIVRECLGMIENEASTYAEPVWAVELVNDIKEHFGVEE